MKSGKRMLAVVFTMGIVFLLIAIYGIESHALSVMVATGILAFVIVCLFMVLYYKVTGVVACITLLLQSLLQLLAISIPQYTLTLSGMAGIILSIGMAVDANIIISERISEELLKEGTVRQAIRNGYQNGITSVLDGNLTTAGVAIILMIFGSGSMFGFGYTLFVGMIVNLFVGVPVSKHLLLNVFTMKKKRRNAKEWFRKKKEFRLRGFYAKRKVYVILSILLLVIGGIGSVRNEVWLDTAFIGGAGMKDAWMTILLSFLFIFTYICFRFHTLCGPLAAAAAVIALVYDVAVTFFVFVIVKIPLNDTFVAVILTMIGYSVNNTIVVFDRIRENRKERILIDAVKLNDLSLSQVLSRSINTTFTTSICILLLLAASIVFRIRSIFEFSLPMLFGLVCGCYSSLCIASILWTSWEKRRSARRMRHTRKGNRGSEHEYE